MNAQQAELQPEVAVRLTALLYRNARLGQALNIVVSGSVALTGYWSRPGQVILVWWLAMVALSLLRIRQASQYSQRDPAKDDDARWRAAYLRTTAAASLLWLIGEVAVMWLSLIHI